MKSRNKNISTFQRRMFLSRGAAALAGGVLLAQRAGKVFAQKTPAGPIVTTAAGKLRGARINEVCAFKGIAYGASTAGAARFMPPRKPPSWTGVRDALELGERAPQAGQDIMFVTFPDLERPEPEGEDCLRLNVWTRAVDRAKRPVMVWLHGGGFVTGSGGFIAYDGANLAHNEDVVVVTLNHRLNVFGFLYVPGVGGEPYADSANLGLQDIIAALAWVRDNIAEFGGDPGNVTIFGQSGGGGKVSALLAMPAAQGLFHRAIIESGSTIRVNTAVEATALAQAFLARLNIKTIDELQTLPMERLRAELVAAMRNPAGPASGPATLPAFTPLSLGPVVDGHWLPAHPFDPTAPAISRDIPLLVGGNETELTFFPGAALEEIDESTLHTRVKTMLHTDDSGADQVIAAYRKSRPAATPLDIAEILATDSGFRKGMHLQVDRKVHLGGAPVYVYYFNWRTPVRGGKFKSSHCLEIPFVFQNTVAMRSMVGTGPDLAPLSKRISGAWAAFARHGHPDHAGLPHWPAYDLVKRPTMVLNTAPRVVEDPDRIERAAIAALAVHA